MYIPWIQSFALDHLRSLDFGVASQQEHETLTLTLVPIRVSPPGYLAPTRVVRYKQPRVYLGLPRVRPSDAGTHAAAAAAAAELSPVPLTGTAVPSPLPRLPRT